MIGVLMRLIPLFALTLALDWSTKQWAERVLVLHQPLPVLGEGVRLTLGYNPGVAFGIFANGGVWVVLAGGAVMLGGLVWLVLAVRAGRMRPFLAWFAGALLGGGVGNLLDRLDNGHVTDFIDVGLGALRWPTFNVADVCIVVAVSVVMFIYVKEPTVRSSDPYDMSKRIRG